MIFISFEIFTRYVAIPLVVMEVSRPARVREKTTDDVDECEVDEISVMRPADEYLKRF